jgi:5-methyltetrahydrofolate--homocysteine methyltransferase
LYTDESRQKELTRFHTLRQQWQRQGQECYRALADYIAPVGRGREDYLGAFAVTAGLGCDELAGEYARKYEDDNSINTKALADRLAEALAEMLHEQVRQEWGYEQVGSLKNEELIEENYRGIRPAAGYPSQPDHTEKRILFDLLQAEANASVKLTESFAMWPAASVSGLYFAHPESRYFAVDRITREQVEDYARRKRMTVAEIERWLAPNLGYDP